MKRFIPFIFFILISCSVIPTENWYDINVPTELLYADSETINKWVWNDKNIQYKAYSNNVKPIDVLKNKEADCKGKTITALAIFYQVSHQKGNVLYGYNNTKEGFHVEADYCGKTYINSSFTVYSIISFDEIKNYF